MNLPNNLYKQLRMVIGPAWCIEDGVWTLDNRTALAIIIPGPRPVDSTALKIRIRKVQQPSLLAVFEWYQAIHRCHGQGMTGYSMMGISGKHASFRMSSNDIHASFERTDRSLHRGATSVPRIQKTPVQFHWQWQPQIWLSMYLQLAKCHPNADFFFSSGSCPTNSMAASPKLSCANFGMVRAESMLRTVLPTLDLSNWAGICRDIPLRNFGTSDNVSVCFGLYQLVSRLAEIIETYLDIDGVSFWLNSWFCHVVEPYPMFISWQSNPSGKLLIVVLFMSILTLTKYGKHILMYTRCSITALCLISTRHDLCW